MGMVGTARALGTWSSDKLLTLPMLSMPAILEDAGRHLHPTTACLPWTPDQRGLGRSDLGPAAFPARKLFLSLFAVTRSHLSALSKGADPVPSRTVTFRGPSTIVGHVSRVPCDSGVPSSVPFHPHRWL